MSRNTLQTLWSALFSAVVAGGASQYLQGLAQAALQSQAELLRCVDVLAEHFGKESLHFCCRRRERKAFGWPSKLKTRGEATSGGATGGAPASTTAGR